MSLMASPSRSTLGTHAQNTFGARLELPGRFSQRYFVWPAQRFRGRPSRDDFVACAALSQRHVQFAWWASTLARSMHKLVHKERDRYVDNR